MTPTTWVVIAIAAVALLLVVFLVAIYNRLVTLRQRYLNAWSQIDVQLKRRYDLVPNLVETVKGYMAHERQTLEAVTAARNAAAAAGARVAADPRDTAALTNLAGAEGQLAGALGQFRLLAENYPQLKADQHALRLIEELSTTENRVAFARQAYNDSVMVYNATRESFPHIVVANALGFTEARLFEIEAPAEREVVKVSLDR